MKYLLLLCLFCLSCDTVVEERTTRTTQVFGDTTTYRDSTWQRINSATAREANRYMVTGYSVVGQDTLGKYHRDETIYPK